MDTILDMAIDLAYQLQQDPRCQAVLAAQKEADADEGLQQLIGEFNMKRMAINTEEGKDENERDVEKLRDLNFKIVKSEQHQAVMDALLEQLNLTE